MRKIGINKRSILKFSLMCLFWGTTANAVKIGLLNGFTKFLYAGLRYSFASVFIFLSITVLKKKNVSNKLKDKVKIHKNEIGKMFTLAVFMFIIPDLTFFSGIVYLPTNIASIIGATIPLFTIIFAHILLNDDKFTIFKLLGLLIISSGMIFLLISTKKSFNIQNQKLYILGFTLNLITCISVGFANVLARKFELKTNFSNSMFIQTLFAGIIILIISIFTEDFNKIKPNWKAYATLIHVASIGTVIPFLMYYSMISRVGPSKMSSVSVIIPFISVIFSLIFFRERLNIFSFISSVIIFIGVIIIIAFKGKPLKINYLNRKILIKRK